MREEEIIVGGQAVIEGVMMRTPNAYAVAVRRPDGEIVSKEAALPKLTEKYPFLKLPILRGSALLLFSMALGIKALNFSTEVAMAAELNSETKVIEANTKSSSKEQRSGTALMILPALAFNLVIFVFIPLFLTNLIFLIARGETVSTNVTNFGDAIVLVKFYLQPIQPSVLFNLVDGLIRMALFLIFIGLISRMKDIKRVFQYHGAEHKVVFNWESGQPLTVENARLQPRQHPRCGTSFLMVVMLVSIAIFSIIKFDALLLNFLARILLIPLVAGLSYEFIRLSAKCLNPNAEGNWNSRLAQGFFIVLTAPGLWLQNITTQEPSDDQLEVAIYALERSLGVDSEMQLKPLAAD